MNKFAFIYIAFSMLSPWAFAEEAAKPPSLTPAQMADAKALLELVGEFTKAFEAGDAQAIAATFTQDAQVSDNTGSTYGRSAIRDRFAGYFATNPKSTITIQVNSLRFLSPDVVIENGHSIIQPTVEGSQPDKTAYTVVYVRQKGKWLQSSLDDRPVDEATIPDRLKDLEWLVGDWVTESTQAVVSTSVKWAEDQHYLVRDYTVTIEGKPALKGTQRIGWDASRKQIRSWLFDSKGGFGDGLWTRAGDQWMIKANGVRDDGTTATATQLLTRIDRDHVRWSAFDRTEGDQSSPNLEEITLVRKPPQPAVK